MKINVEGQSKNRSLLLTSLSKHILSGENKMEDKIKILDEEVAYLNYNHIRDKSLNKDLEVLTDYDKSVIYENFHTWDD